MTDPRQTFLDDVRRYLAAGERLTTGVTEFMEMNRAALEDLEAGMGLAESFRVRDSARWSRQVSSLLDDFEACRRSTRSSAAAALLEEGCSITDVGRAFGVSHQLASRFAKGATAADGTGEAAPDGDGGGDEDGHGGFPA